MIKYQKNKKAFSLIEIGIVMIVIGILIAAVMSGRDVLKSGDVKYFYQKFAGKWQTIATSYYDRSRVNIGDNDNDGYMDNIKVDATIMAKLQNAGIRPCKVLQSNRPLANYDCHPGEYYVDGENVQATLEVYLASQGIMNYIVFRNIPLDYAISIDRITDSYSDGTKGNGLCFGKYTGAALETNSTVSFATLNASDTVDFGMALEH